MANAYRLMMLNRLYPPVQHPHPPLWFGGSSEAAIELASEQVDTYLTWGEPPAAVKEKLELLKAKAAAKGRSLELRHSLWM